MLKVFKKFWQKNKISDYSTENQWQILMAINQLLEKKLEYSLVKFFNEAELLEFQKKWLKTGKNDLFAFISNNYPELKKEVIKEFSSLENQLTDQIDNLTKKLLS